MTVANPARYAAEVAAGAAWLDANYPAWLGVFIHDRAAGLHMDDCDRCVLGYVLGSYWDARSPVFALGGRTPGQVENELINEPPHIRYAAFRENMRKVDAVAVPLGFSISETQDDRSPLDEDWEPESRRWEDLGAAWQALIQQRLADQARAVQLLAA
jgi:hypothetical protein